MFIRPASLPLHPFVRFLVVLSIVCASLPVRAQAAASPLAPVMRAAIQGDMQTALSEARALDPTQLSERAASVRQCMLDRFASDTPIAQDTSLPAPAADILEAYRQYWTSLMLRRTSKAEAEAALQKTLARFVPQGADLDATTDAVKTRLEALGLHAQTGVTLPYYELLIWRREDTQHYDVKLPEETVQVTVVFMDDFVVRGWLGYATCGISGSGGWATSDGLRAVSSVYDRNSENFRISYLAHEAQHFADYKRYPKLEQPELEYRAKLVELTQSQETTWQLLLMFATTAARGREVPHAHAQYWLITRLRERLAPAAKAGDAEEAWRAVDDAAIRKVARDLLLESSAELRRGGATTMTRFLRD
jgi:hypothetical protein